MYTIGTAGHVDHGKSALVKALTGVDPDRLREEKERGLTIELGFAPLDLPGGTRVSIVDVPGHERFIKTMLAGVGGIDLALLVIAADEGVMPQTREHLAIIDLLGIERGVVALTKADLADESRLAAARSEVAEVMEGTTLATATIVACSAMTGAGLGELVAAIEAAVAEAPARASSGRARLPIDRVFTMPGFGTVVTGTLLDGALRVGQEVEVVPGELTARVRGLQNHGESVDEALPGTRTAVNLSGVAVEDLRRGMVVAEPSAVHATMSVDVRLQVVKHLGRDVKHNLRVAFHTGASEVGGRLVLLDADALRPGKSGWAQVRLDGPVAALAADRFIIRDPNDTLGGGRIVAVAAARHKRYDAATIAKLEQLANGATAAANLTTEPDPVRTALASHHHQWRLRRGMPREELRSRLKMEKPAFEALMRDMVDRGSIVDLGVVIASSDYKASLTENERAIADTYIATLRTQPFSPPLDGRPDEELFGYLVNAGEVVAVGDCVFESAAYEEAVASIRAHLVAHGALTLAEVRDLLATSRKYAQALLEHLDARQVTRRVGDGRVLR